VTFLLAFAGSLIGSLVGCLVGFRLWGKAPAVAPPPLPAPAPPPAYDPTSHTVRVELDNAQTAIFRAEDAVIVPAAVSVVEEIHPDGEPIRALLVPEADHDEYQRLELDRQTRDRKRELRRQLIEARERPVGL
jgi:hypothetical protein